MLQLIRSFFAALTFYTIIPLPSHWQLDFQKIARWLPFLGLIIGFFLILIDFFCYYLEIPLLTRSVIIVSLWVLITGGLHLDGVMDTGDSFGVYDQKRRLDVMRDSFTGAFGVMAGILLLLIKSASLTDITSSRQLALLFVPACARWGQLVAIAFYPYLRTQGKGLFPKQGVTFFDPFFGLVLLLVISGFFGIFALQFVLINLAISIMIDYFFFRHFGGFTGDVYGAVVEWTEAIGLLLFVVML